MPTARLRVVVAALSAPSALALLYLAGQALLQSPMFVEPERHYKLLGTFCLILGMSYIASAIGAVGVALVMRRFKLAVCGAKLVPLSAVAGAVVGVGFVALTESTWFFNADAYALGGAICAIIISTVFVVLAGLPWSARKARALQASSAQA